jgi:hypothetical protein
VENKEGRIHLTRSTGKSTPITSAKPIAVEAVFSSVVAAKKQGNELRGARYYTGTYPGVVDMNQHGVQ